MSADAPHPDEIEAASKAAQIHQSYIDVFGSPAGQIVLEDLVKQCGIFEVRVSTDPYQAIFDDGTQYWYKRIKMLLETSPQETARKIAPTLAE